jgi:hypothetical protein
MITTRVAASALFLFGFIMAIPLSGKSQTATPWTAKQCHDRMEQLFEIGSKANDPLVDMSEVLRELMQDIGERAGSSFAIHCRMKEANSIQILMHRLESIEADRQETASAANRTEKLGIKMENFSVQNSAYDPGFTNFGKGMGF